MNTLLRMSALALACGLLAGCATLPLPEPTRTKLLAVVFDRGEAKTGYFKQVAFYVTTTTHPKAVVLKSGVNFLPVPADATEETILVFGGAGTSAFIPTTMFEQAVNATVAIADDSSLVLWPVVLGYKSYSKDGRFIPEGTVTPMKPEKVKSLLDSWKRDKNAGAWAQIVAAP
jgi:hypothetical protein